MVTSAKYNRYLDFLVRQYQSVLPQPVQAQKQKRSKLVPSVCLESKKLAGDLPMTIKA